MNRIEKRMEELQNKNEKAFVTYMNKLKRCICSGRRSKKRLRCATRIYDVL